MNELKEVTLFQNSMYLSEYEEYKPEEIKELCDSLIKKAESEGLTNCYLRFESTREPYEDYLGPVSITPCGYREFNYKEKKELEKQKEIESLAKELGITFYEATTIKNLKERGKIK